MKEKNIIFPSILEQQKIVEYIDAQFERIDALKANAEQQLQAAKDLFQSALKDLMTPKEGWEENAFSNVCEITSILVDPTLEEYKNLLHVGGANIESETGKLFNLKTASEEQIISGKFHFDSTMVLYNKIRPYLKKVARPDFIGLCSADMYPLKPKANVSKDFLFYILLSEDFTNYAIKGSARAGMPKVNRNYLFAYKCLLPSKQQQFEITTKLDEIKNNLTFMQTNYEQTITLCNDLKQALLKKVFG